MTRNPARPTTIDDSRRGERGSALFLALVLIVVLTLIGMALLTRSMLVTRIAGSERWSTKAFYAADSGIEVAKTRLRTRTTTGFTFDVADLREADRSREVEAIEVQVGDMSTVGPPRIAMGSQTSGGQGGGDPLYILAYRGTSNSRQELTGAERQITATMNVGPMPLTIPNP